MVECHTSVFDFITLFLSIIQCQENTRYNDEPSRKWDTKASTDGSGFPLTISVSYFSLLLTVLKKITNLHLAQQNYYKIKIMGLVSAYEAI